MESPVSLGEQINRAIVAHGQWKVRLAQAIEAGQSEFTVEAVQVDNRCAFGTWLYGLGPEQRADASFGQVKELHAAFHRAAADVLGLALKGRKSEASAAMGLRGPYGQASTKLTIALSAWQRSAV